MAKKKVVTVEEVKQKLRIKLRAYDNKVVDILPDKLLK